jgi:hypothetical protein
LAGPAKVQFIERLHSFTTAREFVDYFLDGNILRPKSLFDVSEKFISGYFFRGQARKDWTLLPVVHRSPDALKNFTPQLPSEKSIERGNLTIVMICSSV